MGFLDGLDGRLGGGLERKGRWLVYRMRKGEEYRLGWLRKRMIILIFVFYIFSLQFILVIAERSNCWNYYTPYLLICEQIIFMKSFFLCLFLSSSRDSKRTFQWPTIHRSVSCPFHKVTLKKLCLNKYELYIYVFCFVFENCFSFLLWFLRKSDSRISCFKNMG